MAESGIKRRGNKASGEMHDELVKKKMPKYSSIGMGGKRIYGAAMLSALASCSSTVCVAEQGMSDVVRFMPSLL